MRLQAIGLLLFLAALRRRVRHRPGPTPRPMTNGKPENPGGGEIPAVGRPGPRRVGGPPCSRRPARAGGFPGGEPLRSMIAGRPRRFNVLLTTFKDVETPWRLAESRAGKSHMKPPAAHHMILYLTKDTRSKAGPGKP